MKGLLKICSAALVFSLFALSAYADNAPDAYGGFGNFIHETAQVNALYGAADNTFTDEQGVEYEPYSVFYVVVGYDKNTVSSDIKIPAYINGKRVYSIAERAFFNCAAIESVTIGENISSIGAYAFLGCESLREVNILSSALNAVGGAPFAECESLEEINMQKTERSDFYSIDGVFYGLVHDYINDDNKTAVIAYPAAKKAESYDVSEGTEMIAFRAFDGCKYLKNITFPQSVSVIDGYALNGCIGLENAVLGSGISQIGECAFQNCSSITEINLPKKLSYIDARPFFGCNSLEKISVEYGNRSFTVKDNVLYTYDKKELIYYPPMRQGSEYAVLDGTEKIRSGAFFRAYNIKSLKIPDTVTCIEAVGIRSCTEMTEFNLPSGLKELGDEAVSFCTSLKEIIIPDGLTQIPECAFKNCSSLASVYIPNSVTQIGKNAFLDCSENITILGESGSYAEKYASDNQYEFSRGACVKFVDGKTAQYAGIALGGKIEYIPQRAYFDFDGWYTDSEYTEKWDLDTAVGESMTLYAKWNPIKYTVEIINNTIYVTPDDETPKMIFIAFYDKYHRMLGVVTQDASAPVVLNDLNKPDNINIAKTDYVRIFLWSGKDSVFPLCRRLEYLKK